jgi:hypothetical protein
VQVAVVAAALVAAALVAAALVAAALVAVVVASASEVVPVLRYAERLRCAWAFER